MALRHMGHRCPRPVGSDSDRAVPAVAGYGTVKIGRDVIDDIGGVGRGIVSSARDFSVLGERLGCLEAAVAAAGRSMPDTTGGGRSSASLVLWNSSREKSLACHHSRNFKAKIDTGSRSLSDRRISGYIFRGALQRKPRIFDPRNEEFMPLGVRDGVGRSASSIAS